MLLNTADLAPDHRWRNQHLHARLDHTGLNTTNRHSANSADLVRILERNAQRTINRARRRSDSVKSTKKSGAGPPIDEK